MTPAKTNLARLLVPHAEDCMAMESVEAGHWTDPYWVPATYGSPVLHSAMLGDIFTVVNRAADGTKRGNTYKWLVIQCNAPNCKAEGIIRELAITDLFERLT